jgi:hypothetical protein
VRAWPAHKTPATATSKKRTAMKQRDRMTNLSGCVPRGSHSSATGGEPW